MSVDDRVLDLLLRYEELLGQGKHVTPEELCHASPELVAEVRARIQGQCALNPLFSTPDQFEESFPTRTTPVGSEDQAIHWEPAGQRYRPLRFHAKGGLGEVFVAHDAELGREVALKRIQERHQGDIRSRHEFLREAEITSRLEHPGIVPVHGLIEDESGQPCYAMRFIQGESLDAAIKRFHEADKDPKRNPGERSMAMRELLNRFVAVCNTIAYAHSRGVLHRDLKPQNIMLGKYGETLVVDWGLAKPFERSEAARATGEETVRPSATQQAGHETRAGDVKGTPAYMSPEQASGRINEMGPASDVFALGATLYAILTGMVPYQGGGALDKAIYAEVTPPRQVKPQVPRPLEAICLKAMALKPGDRYATAKALGEDVDKWLADEPVTARPEPWTERRRRWTRRHRTLITSGVVALLIALVGSIIGVLLLAEAEERERNARFDAETNERAANEAEGRERAARLTAQSKEREANEQRREAEKRREEARFNLYVAQMNLVQREYEAGNINLVRQLLEKWSPSEPGEKNLRNFEWHYWHRLAHLELNSFELKAEAGPASKALFLDDERLAFTNWDGLTIWNANSLQKVLFIPEPNRAEGFLQDLAVSPDGAVVAAVRVIRRASRRDPAIKLWDSRTGQEILTIKGHSTEVQSLVFSHDGTRIATADWEGVKVWDTSTGKNLISVKQQRPPHRIAFSPDATRLACAGQHVLLCETDTGKVLFDRAVHNVNFYSLAFSPEGNLVAAGDNEGTIHTWNATTGEVHRALPGHASLINSVAFSPDGTHIASASEDQTIKLWSTANGEQICTYVGHTASVRCVCFTPDGNRIASLSSKGTVKQWNIPVRVSFSCERQRHGGSSMPVLSFDSRRVVVRKQANLYLFDTILGQEIASFPTGTLAFGADGYALSRDGRLLAFGFGQGPVRLWDTGARKELPPLTGQTGDIMDMTFSPDGTQLATSRVEKIHWGSVEQDGGPKRDITTTLWDTNSGKPVFSLPQGGHVTFSPDGRYFALSKGGKITFHDRTNGQETGSLTAETKGNARSSGLGLLGFSPDGTRLVTSDGFGNLKICDTSSGRILLPLQFQAPTRSRICLRFSPDGDRIAIGLVDGVVKLLDATTGQQVLSFKQYRNPRGDVISPSPEISAVQDVAFSPDGRRLVAVSPLAVISLWECQPLSEDTSRKRALVEYVDASFTRLLQRNEVVRQIRQDPGLNKTDRGFALQVALSHSEDPGELHRAAWDVLKKPGLTKEAYTRASQLAEAARVDSGDGLGPIDAAYYYRLGNHPKALEILTRWVKLNPQSLSSDTACLAFLAMSQHQVGKNDEAKATLDKLRAFMKGPGMSNFAEGQAYLRETEELIERKR